MRKKGTRYWKQKKSKVSVTAWLSSTAFFELLGKPFLGGRNAARTQGALSPPKATPRARRVLRTSRWAPAAETRVQRENQRQWARLHSWKTAVAGILPEVREAGESSGLSPVPLP